MIKSLHMTAASASNNFIHLDGTVLSVPLDLQQSWLPSFLLEITFHTCPY